MAHVKDQIKAAQAIGSARLFSVRHEFPSEWARFRSQKPAESQRFELKINLRPEHYPFWSQGRQGSVTRIDILARSAQNPAPSSVDVFDNFDRNDNTKKGTLAKDATVGNLLRGPLTAGLPARLDVELRLFLDPKEISDLWVAVTWSV